MSESTNKYITRQANKLYPHTLSHYVVVVPYFGSTTLSLGRILYDSPIFNIWCISVVVFIIVRIIIRKSQRANNGLDHNKLTYIPFNTIGLSFGTTSAANSLWSRPENIVVFFIGLSSIFTGIFCSGILLQSFVGSISIPNINSLKDLNKYPSLRYVSNQFANTEYFDNQDVA